MRFCGTREALGADDTLLDTRLLRAGKYRPTRSRGRDWTHFPEAAFYLRQERPLNTASSSGSSRGSLSLSCPLCVCTCTHTPVRCGVKCTRTPLASLRLSFLPYLPYLPTQPPTYLRLRVRGLMSRRGTSPELRPFASDPSGLLSETLYKWTFLLAKLRRES